MIYFAPMLIDMKNTYEIIEHVGGVKVVAERLGVSPHAVRVHRRDNKLPASWYHALENMAGMTLPRELFSFKAVDKVAA